MTKKKGVWNKTKGEIYEWLVHLMGGAPYLITSAPRSGHSKTVINKRNTMHFFV